MNWQIITKVMLPESGPSLLVGAAIAATTILGYSAMAGVLGGGGLGDVAIRYGYYRYEKPLSQSRAERIQSTAPRKALH